MVYPFIKVTQVYNDEQGEKYDRPIFILVDTIEYYHSFEICSAGNVFVVKQDIKELTKRIKNKIAEMESDGLDNGED